MYGHKCVESQLIQVRNAAALLDPRGSDDSGWIHDILNNGAPIRGQVTAFGIVLLDRG